MSVCRTHSSCTF